MNYYDDNYGHWDMEDEESERFYHQVQATNVEKICKGCERLVKIQPHYAYCIACANVLVYGGEF